MKRTTVTYVYITKKEYFHADKTPNVTDEVHSIQATVNVVNEIQSVRTFSSQVDKVQTVTTSCDDVIAEVQTISTTAIDLSCWK